MPEIIYKKSKSIIKLSNINRLYKSVGWEILDEKTLQKTLRLPGLFLSAWDNGKIIGVCRILEDIGNPILFGLAVNPKYQRQGIGRHLTQTCLDWAKKKDFMNITLFAANDDAKKFYKSIGFYFINNAMRILLK